MTAQYMCDSRYSTYYLTDQIRDYVTDQIAERFFALTGQAADSFIMLQVK